MAFSLRKFKADGIRVSGPNRKRAVQLVELHITALATDVDLDIGDNTPGTFWTAALADATYGALATTARAKMVEIAAISNGLVAIKSPQLLDRIQIAAVAAAGQYSVAVDTLGPDIAVNAADGETSWVIQLEYALKDGYEAINADLGTNA